MLRVTFFALLALSAAERLEDPSDTVSVRATGGLQKNRAEHSASLAQTEPEPTNGAKTTEAETAPAQKPYTIPNDLKDSTGKENIRPALEDTELLTRPKEVIKEYAMDAGATTGYADKIKADVHNAKFHDWEEGKSSTKKLEVSDKYDEVRKKLMEKEHLLLDIGKNTRLTSYMAKGKDSVEKNKEYHDALEAYVESLFMMSGGAHRLTKKEFQDHVSLSHDLSRQLHAGDYGKDIHEFLGNKAGHVSAEQLKKQQDFYADMEKKGLFTKDQNEAVQALNHGGAGENGRAAGWGDKETEHKKIHQEAADNDGMGS